MLNGLTLDVTIVPGADAYWIKDAAGGERLGGLVADVLNWVAKEANCTYNIFAIPGPVPMGYLTASGSADSTRWALDQALRTDLLAEWTTDTHQGQRLGLVWPFHHLDLKHVLIVRAIRHVADQALSLPFENWPEFINRSTEPVCVYGGAVRNSILSVLPPSRVKEKPGASEAESHKWAVGELCSGGCAAYVQPYERAENVLAEFNAGGSSSLRILEVPSSQRDGLASTAGGFATVEPWAREHEVRQVSGNPSATAGGGRVHRPIRRHLRIHAVEEYATQASNPGLAGPRQLCYSRVWASPWTVYKEVYSGFRKTRHLRVVQRARSRSGCSTCPEPPPPSLPPPAPPPAPPPPSLPAVHTLLSADQTLMIAVLIAVAFCGSLLLAGTVYYFRRKHDKEKDAKERKRNQFNLRIKDRSSKRLTASCVPMIYDLNKDTEYKLEESEDDMRTAMRTGGDKGAQHEKQVTEVHAALAKHIAEVQVDLERVRDTRCGTPGTSARDAIIEQCQREIGKGGASGSAAVYQAVFQTIESLEREGMAKYQDAAKVLQEQLRQVTPLCEQSSTRLGDLYKEALLVEERAFTVMNGLHTPSESFKGSADCWRLERAALKKLRCAMHTLKATSPPLHLSTSPPLHAPLTLFLMSVSCVRPQPRM